MLISLDMYPVHMVRVGLGDEAVQVAILRLPFIGGQDGVATPGGFFTSKDGEFGVAVDARLSADEVQSVMTSEIQRNAPFIAARLASQRLAVPSESADRESRDEGARPAQ